MCDLKFKSTRQRSKYRTLVVIVFILLLGFIAPAATLANSHLKASPGVRIPLQMNLLISEKSTGNFYSYPSDVISAVSMGNVEMVMPLVKNDFPVRLFLSRAVLRAGDTRIIDFVDEDIINKDKLDEKHFIVFDQFFLFLNRVVFLSPVEDRNNNGQINILPQFETGTGIGLVNIRGTRSFKKKDGRRVQNFSGLGWMWYAKYFFSKNVNILITQGKGGNGNIKEVFKKNRDIDFGYESYFLALEYIF